MFDLNILNIHSLIKGKGIENFLRDHLKANTFEELQIPLKIVATDFWRQKQVIIESGDLLQAIRGNQEYSHRPKSSRKGCVIPIELPRPGTAGRT